jgi:hypothetical protein
MDTNVLKEYIVSAIEWAREVEKANKGLDIAYMIESERNILEETTKKEEWERAYESMVELVQLCEYAEHD